MKLYLVTTGEYDEYSVNQICADRAVAQAWVDAINEEHGHEWARLEEDEIQDDMPATVTHWYESGAHWDEIDGVQYANRAWHRRQMGAAPAVQQAKWGGITMAKGHRNKNVGKNDDGSWKYYRNLSASSTANTEEDAIRLANEAIDRALAQNGIKP